MLHPLFPDKDVNISWILLTRHEAQGQVYHPNKWDPEELQDMQPIQELFGGGVYELIARDERSIVARTKFKLPGPSKPLVPEASAPAPVAAPVMHGGGGSSDAIAAALLNLIPVILQSNTQNQQAMVQVLQAQATQQTQFLTAMMQASKQDGNALIQAMAELSKAQTKTMADAMQMAHQNQQSGKGSSGDDVLEVLTTGIELGRSQAASDKPNDVAETIGAVTQGLMALNEQKKGAAPAPNGAG